MKTIPFLLILSLVQAGDETSFTAENSRFLADLYKDSWAVIIGINDYNFFWDASEYASGIYLIKFQLSDMLKIQRVLLLK